MDETGGSLPWDDVEWRNAAAEWTTKALAARGIGVTGEMTVFRSVAWSLVMRVPTTDGDYFFKAVGERLRYEAALTAFLARRFADECVPLLTHNAARGWLLMPDAGQPIRNTPENRPDVWIGLISRYAELQISLTPDVNELVRLGVPDRRFAALPDVYAGLIEDAYALCAGMAYQLKPEELDALRAMLPALQEDCRRLADAGIPDSLDHGDLHTGNVFVRDNHARFADWGDSCVAHPFVSMFVPMNVFAHQFGLGPESPEVIALRNAYLAPWSSFAPRSALLEAFGLARRIARIFRALSWHNALAPLPFAHRAEHSESALYWLRDYLKQ